MRGTVETWVNSQWKYRAAPGQLSVEINSQGLGCFSKYSATIASLIETCQLNAVSPHAYLPFTLTAIVTGHKQYRIDELLPWNHSGETV